MEKFRESGRAAVAMPERVAARFKVNFSGWERKGRAVINKEGGIHVA